MGKYNKNRSQKSKKTFYPNECTNKMTFQECEMAVLRSAIKESKKTAGKRIVNDEDVQKMIKIVAHWLNKSLQQISNFILDRSRKNNLPQNCFR